MAITDLLLENSQRDVEVLRGQLELQDDPTRERDIDFVLKTDDRQQADLVCSFIKDNHYGTCWVEEGQPGQFRIMMTVHMGTSQNQICCISGLMACLGALFKLEYDGWGCVIQ